MERLDASTRKSALSSHKRSLTLIPYVSEVERQELDEISIRAKEGHPVQTYHCEMCFTNYRPCWIPHRIR